jgi:predicted phage terminase large subunit-like protein
MDQSPFNISAEAIHVQKCKKSLYYFLKSNWNVITPTPFIDSPYIKAFCDEAQRRIEMMGKAIPKEDAGWIVNICPATTKSLVCSIFGPAWAWINYPKLRILCCSHNSTKANEFAVECRRLIKSEEYQKHFPITFLDDQDIKSKFTNEFNGSRSATSVDASVLGGHYDWIIADDLQTIDDVKSEGERNKVNAYATSFLGTRTGNNSATQTWFVMQRLHVNDLVSYLDSTGNNYAKLVLPAEQTSDVFPASFNDYYVDGLLDPIRLNRKELDTKSNLESYFAQYLQCPGDNSDSILKEVSFEIISQEEFDKLRKAEPVHTYVDGAYTANRKNDPTAALAGCLIDNRAYVTDLLEVWAEFPELKRKLIAFSYKNYPTNRSKMFIEPKGPGLSLISDLKFSDINAVSSPAPKDSKQDRLLGIQARVEAMKVVLVQGAWNSKFINEVCGMSRHDDVKDCLCMLVNDLINNKKNNGRYFLGFPGQDTKPQLSNMFKEGWRN